MCSSSYSTISFVNSAANLPFKMFSVFTNIFRTKNSFSGLYFLLKLSKQLNLLFLDVIPILSMLKFLPFILNSLAISHNLNYFPSFSYTIVSGSSSNFFFMKFNNDLAFIPELWWICVSTFNILKKSFPKHS